MKSTPKLKAKPGRPRGGGHGRAVPRSMVRMTPRERLDHIRGLQALQEYKIRQKELLVATDVEAGHAEMREVIRADLLGTLPLRVSLALADKALPAREVRAVVLDAVRDVLASWRAGGMPAPEQKGGV